MTINVLTLKFSFGKLAECVDVLFYITDNVAIQNLEKRYHLSIAVQSFF